MIAYGIMLPQIFFYFNIQSDALVISITAADGRPAGGGPRVIAPAEVEQCYCPRSAARWTKDYGCPASEVQLERDLAGFPAIDAAMMNRTVEVLLAKDGACFVHYVVRRNRIYGKAYGRFRRPASVRRAPCAVRPPRH